MNRTTKRSPKQRVLHLALWAVALVCATFAGLDTNSPFTQSALADGYPGGGSGTCCTYSSHCPGTQLCYEPSGGLAKCSETNPNYCR